MAQRQTTTCESFEGDYNHIVRKIDREQPDYWTLCDLRYDHRGTPQSERGAFWTGLDAALSDAICAHPDCETAA